MSCLLTIRTSSRSILSNRVAADLRHALERGEHAETGRIHIEADLARIFGVSRASIREGLARERRCCSHRRDASEGDKSDHPAYIPPAVIPAGP